MQNQNTKKHSGFEFIKKSGNIEEYKLKKNGLRVLLMENHSFPVAGFMVTYLFGSRNELPGTTGFAHLLEHMAFKETKNERGGSFFDEFEKIGADLNGTTWKDRTNYFEVLPPEHLTLSMKAEAKRMNEVKIKLKNLESEKVVVLNELDWGENSPEQSLSKEVWATAFLAHPYHHSTVGWRSDIENAKKEKLQEMYDTHYRPDNAVITVVGDIDKKHTLALIKKHFEEIKNPKNELPVLETKEPKQKGPRRTVVQKKSNINTIQISYKMPPANSPDIYTLLILSKIIAGNSTSRLCKMLVEKNKATEAESIAFPFKDGGLFSIYITLAKNLSHKEIESLAISEIEKIKQKGITKKELKIAKNMVLSEYEFSKDGVESILNVVNEFIAMGDWSKYTKYKKEIQKVSINEVKNVAQNYLKETQKTTGWFVAQK